MACEFTIQHVFRGLGQTCHTISDINDISQNTNIISQLYTYTITPIIHNHVVAHIQIIIIHTRYFHIIITLDRKRITLSSIYKCLSDIQAIFINTCTKFAKALFIRATL